jgi:NitT/TauT family transport system substrate-binding protein
MLCNGTMDAVFLPEPYASEALLRGNNLNFTTKGLKPQLVVLLASGRAMNDTSRRQQIDLLLQGYNQAVSLTYSLPAMRDSLASVIRSLCQAPDSLVDSLAFRQPRFHPLASPQTADIETVMQWLRSRDKIKKGYQPDSLIWN